MTTDSGGIARERSFVIAPDYSADAEGLVWEVGGIGFAVDALPISKATCDALIAWQSQWDQLAWHDLAADGDRRSIERGSPRDMPGGKPRQLTDPAVWAKHGREGYEIWLRVLRELPSGWKVGLACDSDGTTNANGCWVRWSPDEPPKRGRSATT
jgi:hypothetical protein